MDGHGHGEEDEDNCLQVVRCSKGYVPSLSHWTLQALRSLTCQSSFVRRRNPTLRGRRLLSPATAVVPLLHRSFSRGLLSSGNARVKSDSAICFSSLCSDSTMRDAYLNSVARVDTAIESNDSKMKENLSYNGFSSFTVDSLSSETVSLSLGDSSCDHGHVEDGSSSTDGSSPFRCPLGKADNCQSRTLSHVAKPTANDLGSVWEEKRVKRELDLSEIEMMKERFSKLLLGEDMSGGAKGVCTALAISNAITNLSASIFGELWRLEPLSLERKAVWRRELEWLISVADHIIELVPSLQKFADGSSFEVMISKPRADVHTNLPALRKLDAMLLEFLDSCSETEFWYVDQGVVVTDDDGQNIDVLFTHREEEKWWLPSPKVAATGLSQGGRKCLQHQRECISQILKAAMAINSQVLSEMEVPAAYWDALPKSGKTSLGETIYRHITSEYFSAEAVLCTLDLSTEHNAVEVANRIEAAIHVWRCRRRPKQTHKSTKHLEKNTKYSWGIVKEIVSDAERKEFLAGRAESLLLCLKQKFPGLRQSLLDMTKIQYNRDVGQSILESYSRVLESLAFNVMARIDDILFVDDMTKRVLPLSPPAVKTWVNPSLGRGYSFNLSVGTPFATPLATPSLSPTPSTSPR